ncbi:hypothetical protein [Arthrobacter sp. SW1]|uniref:hypothetical protein n=1 Tax=Arthrobacter sp. SW1 TaxID=1920889 RepID=UPI00209AE1FB|nr:hypothetical protein [Arthrobacter sp. SW1]
MTLPAYESTGRLPGDEPGGEEAAPAARHRKGTQHRKDKHGKGSLAWLWFVVPPFAGAVLGIAWWLLAPGGANLLSGDPAMADPSAPLTRLPRDLMLAALLLLAGCFTAVLLDSTPADKGRPMRTLLATAGGLAGAVAAWQLGLLADQWWGSGVPLPDEDGFTLRSLVVLLVWPGAVALLAFVFNLIGLLAKGTQPDASAH